MITPLRGRKQDDKGITRIGQEEAIENDNPVKGTETNLPMATPSCSSSSRLRMITPLRGRKL